LSEHRDHCYCPSLFLSEHRDHCELIKINYSY
jgi:hypothetical protein